MARPGPGLLHRGRGLTIGALGIIELLLGDGLLLCQRAHPVQVDQGRGLACLLLFQFGLRGLQVRLEGFCVHDEQHITGLDHVAFGVNTLVEESLDT